MIVKNEEVVAGIEFCFEIAKESLECDIISLEEDDSSYKFSHALRLTSFVSRMGLSSSNVLKVSA